jgi:tetratricopeptide (TPR) repeat protein
MKTWLTYFLVSQATGSPLMGLVAVAALWFSGTSFVFGRLPDPAAPFRRWARIRDLRIAHDMNPHNVDVRTELAGFLVGRSPGEAKALLDEVVRRCPDLPLPAYLLGLAHLGLGESAEGRACIERALALKPDLRFGEPMVRLGDHYLALGKPAEARAAYEQATRVHVSYAEAWFKAGKAAKLAGDLAGARAHWTETLAATRHSPPFKRRIDRQWRLRAWLALRT